MEILPDGFELIDAFLKTLPQGIETRPARWIANAMRRSQGILFQSSTEGRLLAIPPRFDEIGVNTETYNHQKQADRGDKRNNRAEGKTYTDKGESRQDVNAIPEPCREINEGAEQREELIHKSGISRMLSSQIMTQNLMQRFGKTRGTGFEEVKVYRQNNETHDKKQQSDRPYLYRGFLD